LIFKAFLPPVFLIGLIKGSILFGWATPSEAGAVGGFGAMLLALFNGRLNYATMESVCHSTARTVAMIFFIIIAATCFAYVYRSLGGDDVVDDLITSAGLGPWGLLFLIMGVVFFLGFFLDWIEITLIVLPVFAPLVINLDAITSPGGHGPLVHHPHGGQSADVVSHAAVRLRAVLSKGIAPREVRSGILSASFRSCCCSASPPSS
jgi:TRAP-type mannitol/chloroaromatic compound transport system permease large subunit